MGYIHLSTNVGALGDVNSTVRRNIYNILKLTKLYFGHYPDSFSIQESGFRFDVRLSPVFGEAMVFNEDAQIIRNGENIRRGVMTFSYDEKNTVAVPNIFEDVELVITIHSIQADKSSLTLNRNKGGKIVDVAIINCYRNQTVVSSEKMLNAIIAAMDILNGRYGVRKYCVCGDFNDEKFYVPGLKEVKNSEMAHKFDKKSAPKFIDKVFSNIENIQIGAVFESCENKEQNEERSIGHKTIAIIFGDVKPAVQTGKFINRIFEKQCDDFKGISPFNSHDLIEGGPEAIELASDYLVKTITGFAENSFIKSSTGRRRNNRKALEIIDNQQNSKSNCPKKAQDFYKFCSEFKNGIQKDDPIKPTLEQFHLKLTKKLNDLNVADSVIITDTVKKIWGDRYNSSIIVNFPSKKEFRKIILSTSNSGARDYLGLSLKQTKTFFQRSKLGFDIYYNLVKAISMTGHIPDSWCTDSISFLYKKKGLRSDASNWRPITIAPSLGKHNEKLVLWSLRSVYDGNDANHAYLSPRSCITAILSVSEHFKKLRQREKELKKIGKRLVVVFSAEDISSAFESIDHGALDTFCQQVFNEKDSEIKIRKLIKNYLTRTSFVVDRETKKMIQVIKRYDDRTSPQGSILSPAFWRIYDKIFSSLYENGLDNLVLENEFLDECFHAAYSDDHVTVLSFVFNEMEDENFIHDIMMFTVSEARNLLDTATKSVGCGINRAKSEILVSNKWILVQQRWTDAHETFQEEVTWLGYSMKIDDDHLLVFTDTKMKSRFQKVRLMMYDIFQYINAIHVRWRIYRVYISPIIEWYLPTIITEPGMKTDIFKPSTLIEQFQQQCLAEVVGVAPTVSRQELNEIMCERSVKEKVQIVASRLSAFCERDLNVLKWNHGGIPSVSRTRSFRSIQCRWDGVETGDLGDWMHMLAEQYRNTEINDRMDKFDDFEARRWANAQNRRIRDLVLLRTRNGY